MKIKLLSLTLAIFICSASFAQLHFGIKAGANVNKITGKSFSDEFTFGYHAGAYATIGFGGKLSIQPEVLFSQLTADTSSSWSSIYHFNKINNIKLNYVTIPILLDYSVAKILSLQAGPQFGVLIDKSKNVLQNGQNAFKNGNFSMVGGAQLKFANVRLYGRYLVGLADISNIGEVDKWKSQTIQVGVGIGI